MSELRVRHPYEYFTRGNTIRANVEQAKRHRWEYTPEYDAGSFVLPGAVQDWLDVEFTQEVCVGYGRPPRPPSIYLLRGRYTLPYQIYSMC